MLGISELKCRPLDCKKITSVNPKRNQPWIFNGRTDAEAEAPTVWPPDAKSQLIGKDPGAGKDWRQKEKGMTEDEMVGWHHRLNGHESEQILGDEEARHAAVHGAAKNQTWLGNQTTTNWLTSSCAHFTLKKLVTEKQTERKWKRQAEIIRIENSGSGRLGLADANYDI